MGDADPDLGAVFDAHVGAENDAKDVEATMATMTAEPAVTHIPTIDGGTGQQAFRSSYSTAFIGNWPEDTQAEPVSRTVGAHQVVDELIMTFTHDREIPGFLSGIAPTGRPKGIR